MKHIFSLLLLLAGLSLTGCEKQIATEQPDEVPTTPTDIDISGQTTDEALTVAEAREAEAGSMVMVKGYVVASTTRSMQNIDLRAPFEGSSAIVLADEPFPTDTLFIDIDSYDAYIAQLMPVCLTDCGKSIRQSLNLVDNPELANHLVYLFGSRERYLSRPGIKGVVAYRVIE